MTAAAFVALRATRRSSSAILEVGLGGRLDATNVAPAMLAVVTSIALDHVEDLGPTLAAIAGEKAGIFRAGRPALVASRRPEALAVFEDAAQRVGAALHRMVDETRVEVRRGGARGNPASPDDAAAAATTLATPLAGAAPGVERGLGRARGGAAGAGARASTRAAIARGRRGGALARAARALPRPGPRRSSLDGCHNADGAAALAAFLDAGRARAPTSSSARWRTRTSRAWAPRSAPRVAAHPVRAGRLAAGGVAGGAAAARRSGRGRTRRRRRASRRRSTSSSPPSPRANL